MNISFVEDGGKIHAAEAETGLSAMEVALSNLVPGILADCGGVCSCATCHVVVDDAWFKAVGEPSEIEQELLNFVEGQKDTSRLSCQIKITPELDGLILHLPAADS